MVKCKNCKYFTVYEVPDEYSIWQVCEFWGRHFGECGTEENASCSYGVKKETGQGQKYIVMSLKEWCEFWIKRNKKVEKDAHNRAIRWQERLKQVEAKDGR